MSFSFGLAAALLAGDHEAMPQKSFRTSNVLLVVGAFFVLVSPVILSRDGQVVFAVVGAVCLLFGLYTRTAERQEASPREPSRQPADRSQSPTESMAAAIRWAEELKSRDKPCTALKSPNGRYEVVVSDYFEIRGGSPLFGRIRIVGASFETDQDCFGEPMAFSADSRFLALEDLVDANVPHTRAVVFDFDRCQRIVVHEQNPGFVRRFNWSAEGLLTIVAWSHLAGESEHVWQVPSAK